MSATTKAIFATVAGGLIIWWFTKPSTGTSTTTGATPAQRVAGAFSGVRSPVMTQTFPVSNGTPAGTSTFAQKLIPKNFAISKARVGPRPV